MAGSTLERMSDFSGGVQPARLAPGPPAPASDADPGLPDPDRDHTPDPAAGPEAATPLESLESRICAGAARIAATTSQWLRLVVEFDRREGWRASGCRSTAQWLSWRCGMSLATAYEHLRVGRVLERLPRIAEEFAAGRLSYSKVRALTRIAAAGEKAGQADPGSTDIRLVPSAPESESVPAGSGEAPAADPAPTATPVPPAIRRRPLRVLPRVRTLPVPTTTGRKKSCSSSPGVRPPPSWTGSRTDAERPAPSRPPRVERCGASCGGGTPRMVRS